MNNEDSTIIELNVGGIYYSTTLKTLTSEENSSLNSLIESNQQTLRDSKDRLFIDRDGTLFRFILDYLRTKTLTLPENFTERQRLKIEADYFRLPNLSKLLDDSASMSNLSLNRSFAQLSNTSPTLQIKNISNRKPGSTGGCIIVGYRGTFANGRDGLADVKFRKISRILVCGRVQLMREVFGDTLNESRDPDHGVSDRYTSRFFLKHTFLEQAFDTLIECNFNLVCAAATGTNSTFDKDNKASTDNEENKWLHYNEFIFVRNN